MTVRRRRSDQSGRSKLHSPGRPDSARREELVRFWAAIETGRMQGVFAHQTLDLLAVDDPAAMPERHLPAPPDIGFELILDRLHRLDQGGVVGRVLWLVVIGGVRDPHQSASFGDREACGPMMAGMGALLDRRPCRCAPFRNSSFRACSPSRRSSAVVRAAYSWIVLAASASSSKAPASYLSTQIRIGVRDRSWRRASPWRVSPTRYARTTWRLKAMLWVR